MHVGAKGSGALNGNKNALKNGLYTDEAVSLRQHIRELTQKSKELMDKMWMGWLEIDGEIIVRWSSLWKNGFGPTVSLAKCKLMAYISLWSNP